MVSLVMVNDVAFTFEATGNFFGSPLVSFAQFNDFFFENTVWSWKAGSTFGFFFKTVPSLGLVTVPPAVKHFPVNLSFRADVRN